MVLNETKTEKPPKSPAGWIFFVLILIGLAAFLVSLAGRHPERAWQTYLINFLFWSAIAQGALVFSAVMHITNARWSGPFAGVADAFAAFFPFSFGLYLVLILGKSHIFPWLQQDLGGKEVWLNIPFLFTRDGIGLLLLYGFGFVYIYYDLQLRVAQKESGDRIRRYIFKRWNRRRLEPRLIKRKMSIFGVLYILAFALVLSLIGYDLIMSMEPAWISTLFGAYIFVKAFYIGLGGLIITAAILHLRLGKDSAFLPSHFHDIGKLFFAFCLVWADFFYVQLVVIWYGNISEETSYVIERTVFAPWKALAWTVFIVCFIVPFIILLNKKVKTRPVLMMLLSAVVIVGIWLEHLLLLGPALSHGSTSLPLAISDGLISFGFLGLMVIALNFFLRRFPEIALINKRPG
jgi:Ni/Fe-hydrogenase subunit HybB-like protein